MKYSYNGKLRSRSLCLRKNMTQAERKLWFEFLRDLPVKFYRQKIIGNYIADFYCAENMTVIEIDGSQHFDEEAMIYDAARSKYFENKGITVYRYNNNEVLCEFEGVCNDIYHKLKLIYYRKHSLTIKD